MDWADRRVHRRKVGLVWYAHRAGIYRLLSTSLVLIIIINHLRKKVLDSSNIFVEFIILYYITAQSLSIRRLQSATAVHAFCFDILIIRYLYLLCVCACVRSCVCVCVCVCPDDFTILDSLIGLPNMVIIWALISFTAFKVGDGGNHANEDCVLLTVTEDFEWIDVDCWYPFRPLCEASVIDMVL